MQAYQDRYATVGMFESRVYPGVADGLDTLHAAGLGLCVVTSKPHVYARRIIEHFPACAASFARSMARS